MIGYLSGKVISFSDGTVILAAGGVGFEVACSAQAYAKLVENGGGEIFTYTAVKEDGISLYGFISAEEKKAFTDLISVSGVGPKMGIAVLSQMTLKSLTAAIATADVKSLAAVKGLGKKTAERIILELKGKTDAQFSVESDGIIGASVTADADAVAALTSLGFTKAESESAVIKAQTDGATGLNGIIAAALKNVR